MKNKHFNAVDADTIPGLMTYFDTAGQKVDPPAPVTHEWLQSHRLLWDKNFLQKYLEQNAPVYFFGQSQNTFDVIDLFDYKFYLKISDSLVEERLQKAERDNSWGKKPEEREEIMQWLPWLDQKAQELGFITIDASLPPEKIMNAIENALSL